MMRFYDFINIFTIASVLLSFVSGCSESRPEAGPSKHSDSEGGAIEFFMQTMPSPLKVSDDYEPPVIIIDSPQNGMIYPSGTEKIEIRGRVVPGTADVWLFQVFKNEKGEAVSAYDKSSGSFSCMYDLKPIPPDVNRTFQITNCMFQVFDVTGRSNCESVSVVVADNYLKHGDPSVKQKSILELSMTEEMLGEGSEYMSYLFNMLLPSVIDMILPLSVNTRDMIGLDIGTLTVDPYVESSPCNANRNCGQLGGAQIGEISELSINTVSGDKIRGSMKVFPQVGPYGNYALFLRGYHELKSLFGKKRVHFQVESDYVELNNIGLRLEVNPSGEVVLIPDFANAEVDLGNARIDYGDFAMNVPDWLLSGIVGLILPIFNGLGLEIGLPLMNINDFIIDAGSVISMLENISIEADVPDSGPVIKTTDHALSARLGVSMEIKDWNEIALNPDAEHFVYTPGKDMPSVIADFRDGGEDMIAVVSDEILNQAAFVLVQSGILQKLIDEVDIVEALRANMPELTEFVVANSPDLKISTQITTPPICDFSKGPEFSRLQGFGNIYVTNLIIELKNVKFEGIPDPEDYKLSIDMYAAIGLQLSNDNRKIQAEIKFIDPENTMDIKILYSTFPGAVLINPLISMVRGILVQLMDIVFPEMLNIDIPLIDEIIGFELPSIEIMATELIDNCLVAKIGVEF